MEQKEKSIGTQPYLVTQMDAIRALKVQTKIIKLLGPGATSLVGADKESIKSKIAELIPALMTNFDDNLVNDLVLMLFEKGVMIRDKEGNARTIDFSTHFAGKAMEMWQVVGFILEANFSMGE